MRNFMEADEKNFEEFNDLVNVSNIRSEATRGQVLLFSEMVQDLPDSRG